MTIELERFSGKTNKLDDRMLENTIRAVEEHLALAASAAEQAPGDVEVVRDLESTLTEAAVAIQQAAPEHPELAEEALEPLARATDIFVHITGETPFKKAEIAARVAAKVHNAGENGGKVVELANEQIDDTFAHTHTADDELGARLDSKLATAYKEAIRDKRKFDVALGHEVAKAYRVIEEEVDTDSPLAQFRSDRAAQKSARKANFARRAQALDATGAILEATGQVIADDNNDTEEIEVVEQVPSPDDEKAYTNWKNNIAGKMTRSTFMDAVQYGEFDRLPKPGEIEELRAAMDLAEEAEEKRAA